MLQDICHKLLFYAISKNCQVTVRIGTEKCKSSLEKIPLNVYNGLMILFWGKVIHGEKRGKKLGFPTANIKLHKPITEGIYAAITKVKGKEYHSVTFIGAAKTFDQTNVIAESYILDFNQTIYGEWVSVQLLKHIRGNKKFDSVEALIKQMKQDEHEARQFFKNNP